MSLSHYPRTFQHILVLIYAVGLIACVGTAIWDVKRIVYDYISDNRLTIVKKMNISSDYPFLGKVRVCLFYDDSLLGVPIDRFWTAAENYWADNESIDQMNISDFDLNLAKSIFELLVPYRKLLYGLDRAGGGSMIENGAFDTRSSNLTALLIDHQLSNPKSLNETIQNWKLVQKAFIRKYHRDTPAPITLDKIEPDNICFLIPLREDMRPSEYGFTAAHFYYLDFENSKRRDDGTSRQAARITMDMFDEEVMQIQLSLPNATMYFTILISNYGIFDSSQVSACTLDFETTQECLDDVRAATIQHVCKCTQYSRALKKAMQEGLTISLNLEKPFCTKQIYEMCWARAMAEVERNLATVNEGRRCEPCRYSRNTYKFENLDSSRPSVDRDGWYARGWIQFTCKDHMYLLFEDRIQFTSAQLVSQIGGDLGLYTGFSMLSLLQLILVSFEIFRRRKDNESGGGKGFWNRFRRFIPNWARKFSDEGMSKDAEAPEMYQANDWERRFGELEKQVQLLRQTGEKTMVHGESEV